MKKIYVMGAVLSFLFTTKFNAQTTYVPDDNFEQELIDLGYDTSGLDNYVPTANIENVEFLNLNSSGVSDLTGIEDFKALRVLWCAKNNLTAIDVSYNTALEELSCHDNSLTTLDVTKNTALADLDCGYTGLTTLDVSENTLLYRLTCNNSDIISLDLTKNVNLGYLNCSGNALTTLDVSKNTSLINLICGANKLTALDVSNIPTLQLFDCFYNNITSLDFSQNYNLTYISCMFNKLTSLNVKNGVNESIKTFSARLNPDLSCIQVDDVDYSTANWTNIDATASFQTDCNSTSALLIEETTAALKMAPNPANDVLTLTSGTQANYVIVNKQEETLLKGNLAKGSNTINTSKLSSGLYFVKVFNKGSETVKKLIIE